MLRELLISYLRGGTFSIFGREAMFGAWHGLTIDLRRKLVGTSHHASHEGKPCNAVPTPLHGRVTRKCALLPIPGA